MRPLPTTLRPGAAMLGAALLLMVAFATSYVGAFHRPEPHRVPLELIAPAGQAQSLADRLDRLPDRPLEVRVAGDRARALARVRDREAYGAYDVQANRLYVASAANKATASALQLTLDAVLARQQRPAVRVVDLVPLPAEDPNGTTIFYVVVAWVFGGYLAATLLGLLAGPRSSSRRLALLRLGGMLAFAVLGSLLTLLVNRAAFGVLDAHLLKAWLAGTLIVAAAGAASIGLQALAGTAGTGLVILLFVVVGNPSAGGPYARPLLPGFWSTIGGLLPPGAGVDLLRGVLYFDDTRIAGPLLVLLAWALAGGALALWHGGRTLTDTDARIAAGAGAA